MFIVVAKKAPFRKIRCFSADDSEVFWQLYDAMLRHLDLESNTITVAHCSESQLPDWIAANMRLTLWERLVARLARRIWVEEHRVSLRV